MSATITGVTVDAVTGKVTAKFTVTDSGVAVTDTTKFTKPTVILAKLVKDSHGVLNWVGYTNQFNTKNEAIGLIAQTKGENSGTLVANADGSFSYTFALTGATAGDIRTVTHAHNVAVSTKGTPGIYATDIPGTAYPTTLEIPNAVSYEPTKTHRVAMTFSKTYAAGSTPATGAAGLDAWFDFVPAGGPLETRDIVKISNCANCHANRKMHAAYRVEVCVTCHNPSTKDPFTGETVALENIVHKLHRGADLPALIKPYMINGENFSIGAFPGVINKCQACHIETGNANGANWRTNPTAAACITCHDDTAPRAHAASNANLCTSCHSTGMVADTSVVHNK
jgi:OmcA/MtrC family decaheme c-type cytochrome